MIRAYVYIVTGSKYVKGNAKDRIELPPFTNRESARKARRSLKKLGYRTYFGRYTFDSLNDKGM